MIANNNIPRHVAFIMDGNGRWAKAKGLARTAGHREGMERVREIVRCAGELGLKVVTFFAFSTENWSRPSTEVNLLMRLLDAFLTREINKLDADNVRFKVIGSMDRLSAYLQDKIAQAQEKTADNTGLTLVIALNYGSRQEIAEAAKHLAADAVGGKVAIEEIDVEIFGRYLYTCGIADPDLLIRTSGEMRLSNFLLWQASYTELYFCDKYWPEFNKDELIKALEAYQGRHRRYGAL